MSGDRLHHVACPLCGVDRPRLLFRATRSGREPAEHAGDLFRCTSPHLARHGPMVRCADCGMVYADPQPQPEELLREYVEVQDPTYLEQRRGRELTFGRALAELHRFARPPGRLLDVGCYVGVFLEVAAAGGWEVHGVEPCRWAAEIARGLGVGPVHCGTLDDLPAGEPFAAATLWDVLEHLSDPVHAVGEIASRLRPGGVLALSTHLVDSLPARLLGTHYPFLMDMHLVHFTRPTLTRLLEGNGLRVLALRGHRRVVMLDYFLERVWRLVPALGPPLRSLARLTWARSIAVTVRGLGLVDVYAERA